VKPTVSVSGDSQWVAAPSVCLVGVNARRFPTERLKWPVTCADVLIVVWFWIVAGMAAWLLVSVLTAFTLGRVIRLADHRTDHGHPVLTTADLPLSFAGAAAHTHRPKPAPGRRRALPLPPVGMALAGLAVSITTASHVVRLTGATGPFARLLTSGTGSALPQTFVAALFAAAAIVAFTGAIRAPGRRAWWLAVALVAATVGLLAVGRRLDLDGGASAGSSVAVTLGVSGGLAAVVLVLLWVLTRNERRDRRRVLGALTLYVSASIGLSAVSAAAPRGLLATVTYLQESGSALAAVAFLMGVLVGVAPGLVLPADWALRRAADAQTHASAAGAQGARRAARRPT
jgi:hypothetical protein